MKREYWLGLALAGFLMMLPLGPLQLLLLLSVPGFAVLLWLKDRFDAVELVAYSFTLSILTFSISTVAVNLAGIPHAGALVLGLFVVATGLYYHHKNASVELTESTRLWPVLGIALFIFLAVLYITSLTFTVTPAGLVCGTTHASDLNFHLSISQRYIESPHIPPEDPYLPGYSILYQWLMQVMFGELGLLTGVDLFVILKVVVPLASALIFTDAFLLARHVFKSDRDALVSAIIYVGASGLSWAYIGYQYFIQNIPNPDVFKLLVYEWPGIMTLKYDPISLFFFLPQTQTFGLLATLFGFLLYLETLRTRSIRYAVVTGLALAALVLFHMITAFPVFLALGILFLYVLIKGRDAHAVLVAAIPLVVGAAASVYQLSLLQSGLGSQVVLGHNNDVPLTFLFSLGLLVPFALYGMYVKHDDKGAGLLIAFAALNFVMLNVLELPATLNTYRFLDYLALPLSLFAGFVLSRWLFSGKLWQLAIAAIVILLMILSTAIIVGFYDQSTYTHATTAEYNGLLWLRENAPKNAIIFEEPGFFPRAPVVTGRDVAYSGEIYTMQYHNVDLQAQMYDIMSITDPGMLYDTLAGHNVSYVFVGLREASHPFAQALADPNVFTLVYDKDGVRIYEVPHQQAKEVNKMEISALDWLAFFAAIFYLLLVPGFNLIRTLGWNKRYNLPEKAVIAFGISVCILVIVSTLMALPFSIGLNFYTLVILETLIIVLTTKEVVDAIRKAINV